MSGTKRIPNVRKVARWAANSVKMSKALRTRKQEEIEREDVRFLGWLLIYPASGARELAAAFGIHRATVYRHLAHLMNAGLVQIVESYGGEARYLLTPRGIASLSQALSTDGAHLARQWQRGPNTPARLIPRLLTIDRLGTFVRTFFDAAPRAQAAQGHATVVRWHIVRDYAERVAVAGERRMTVRTQAALAWTVAKSKTQSAGAAACERERFPNAIWHSAFVVLESGLCDRDGIATRLRNLLRYRESPQRLAVYRFFPPLMVLVENARQADVWLQQARKAAESLYLAPLTGAIAILAQTDNPWQWGWRDLATGASIRLVERLAPLPETALPGGVSAHLEAARAVMNAKPIEKLNPIDTLDSAPLPEVIMPRQRALLTLLARAPLLSAQEIAVIGSISDEPLLAESVARALRVLAHREWIAREMGSDGVVRWYLTDGGLRIVAAIHEAHILHLGCVVTDEAGKGCRDEAGQASSDDRVRLEQRGLATFRRQSAHQEGVYGVVSAFHQALPEATGDMHVAWWETGRSCFRTYHYHGVQRNLRPDAELELIWQIEGMPRYLRLWLEYDRGTMNRRDLERKMQAYADYWQSKAWASEGRTALPSLLFIVPDTQQESRVREAAQEKLSGVHLHLLVTTAAHLNTYTPYGRIWRQIFPILSESEQATRRTLFERG
jgi:Fe2+ or Zn2+ uptake regulation protein